MLSPPSTPERAMGEREPAADSALPGADGLGAERHARFADDGAPRAIVTYPTDTGVL
jgi:hypothetical protein